MGFLPEITCPRCGKKYSVTRRQCPHCNAARPKQNTRAAATTASALSGTAERARAAMDGHWQLVFAGILAASVLLAVIVLIVGGESSPTATPSLPGSSTGSNNSGSAITVSDTYLPSPSPSPVPTPEVQEATITSMELVFLNQTLAPDVTLSKDGQTEIQLELRTFPQNVDVTPEWSSSNENILVVDQTGKVTVVGVDPVNGSNATITVKCCGLEASSIIRVPQYQAAHLTENRYNAG